MNQHINFSHQRNLLEGIDTNFFKRLTLWIKWRTYFLVCLCFAASKKTAAQTAFQYVNTPASATQNALGGDVVSNVPYTSFGFFQNPALMDSLQLNRVGVGILPVFGQGLYSAGAFVFSKKPDNYWGIGFRGITFGKFTGTDAIGTVTEDFGAGNIMITVAYARRRKAITFGTSAKIVSSFIQSFNSTAVLFDFGGTFRHPEKDFSFGLTARNIGFTVSRFTDVQQSVPFDLVAGVTTKPEFMPVRFTFTAGQLYRFKSLDQALSNAEIATTQQIFGHLSGGAELLFSKKIIPMVGFNYRTNFDYKLNEQNRFGGLSYGLRFQANRFQLAASRTNYLPQIGRWVFSGSWGF